MAELLAEHTQLGIEIGLSGQQFGFALIGKQPVPRADPAQEHGRPDLFKESGGRRINGDGDISFAGGLQQTLYGHARPGRKKAVARDQHQLHAFEQAFGQIIGAEIEIGAPVSEKAAFPRWIENSHQNARGQVPVPGQRRHHALAAKIVFVHGSVGGPNPGGKQHIGPGSTQPDSLIGP